jgi:hypothetical protein
MPKKFGYVGNAIYQIKTLLEAEDAIIHGKVFYLADYDIVTIRDWANIISLKTRNKPVSVLPEAFVLLAARIGDIMKIVGIQEPPFSTFRMHNMRADTSGIPLENMKLITGRLPYTLEQGVEETLCWLKKHGYVT